jgi:hypothetical protein
MNGIGASGAWWPISLSKFPENIKEQAAHRLFSRSDDGLGLTSYRYNVGGGGVFVGDLRSVMLSGHSGHIFITMNF